MSDKLVIQTSGVLCRNGRILLHWPEAHEFDLMTALRNRPSIRRWFLDDRGLDLAENRTFLMKNGEDPKTAVLAIRWVEDQHFLGTIGWSDWDQNQRRAQFGRLIVDPSALRKLSKPRPRLAEEASQLLMGFAFENMGLLSLYADVILYNRRSISLCRRIGMHPIFTHAKRRPSGEELEMMRLEIARENWLIARSKYIGSCHGRR